MGKVGGRRFVFPFRLFVDVAALLERAYERKTVLGIIKNYKPENIGYDLLVTFLYSVV